ncbi:MAG TPA: hypothetical protein VGR50_08920 [Terriglobales bacterium]|nr:hypothetical protein [Terriglobales bacterium]
MTSPRNLLRESLRLAANPWLLLTEVGWRWGFGLGTCVLLFAAWLRVFGAVAITEQDVAALSSHDPTLIAGALLHVLQETGPDLLAASFIVVPAALVLWVALATFGRLATLELLLPGSPRNAASFAGVLATNIFRALWTVGVFIGCLLTLGTASFISLRFSHNHEEPNLAVYFVLIAIALPLEAVLWAAVNWFFSLTPIFSVREGCGPFAAAKQALHAIRGERREFFSVSGQYGSLRLGALLALLALCGTLGAAAGVAGGRRGVVVVMVVLSLAYFVVADWLYLARMVAYIDRLREPIIAFVVHEAPAVNEDTSPQAL